MPDEVTLNVTTIAEAVTVETTAGDVVEIKVVAQTGPTGATGATGPAGPNSVTSATTSDGTAVLSVDEVTIGDTGAITLNSGSSLGMDAANLVMANGVTFSLDSTSRDNLKTALAIASADITDVTSDGYANKDKLLKTDIDGALKVDTLVLGNRLSVDDKVATFRFTPLPYDGVLGGNTEFLTHPPYASGYYALTDNVNGIPDKLTNGTVAGTLTVNSTSYTYGAGSAIAHGTALGVYDSRIASFFTSPYIYDQDNFLGRFTGATGGGAFNWVLIGSGSIFSDAPFLHQGYSGGATLTTNNNAFFYYTGVVSSANIAKHDGYVFDFTFNVATSIAAENIFIGIRNAASSTVETGRRGLWYEAGVDTNWQLLHETSAGVKTKVDTGKPVAVGQTVRVTIKFASATQTDIIIACSDSTTPVAVSATSGFSATGSLGLGFLLRSTTANAKYLTAMRAILAWTPPTL